MNFFFILLFPFLMSNVSSVYITYSTVFYVRQYCLGYIVMEKNIKKECICA